MTQAAKPTEPTNHSQGWGAKVIERLAHDLRTAFPDMKGFSPRNLKYMRAFAEAWPDDEFVQAVLAQLPWYHQLALLDKLRTVDERRWYAATAIEHNWSRNILVIQIDVLTDSVQPEGYVKDLRRRDPELAKGWRQIATPLRVETAGGGQRVNCANTEGLFHTQRRCCMIVPRL